MVAVNYIPLLHACNVVILKCWECQLLLCLHGLSHIVINFIEKLFTWL